MKLIDKDALVAEIEKIIADETESIKSFEHSKNASEVQRSNARIGVLTHLRSLLDTLEVKEVDLDKKIEQSFIDLDYHLDAYNRVEDYVGENIDMVEYKRIAKHFFELGLNAQCKISYVPNIDDSLEELGVDPTSKGAKIFKESYYIALEKLKAQKGE